MDMTEKLKIMSELNNTLFVLKDTSTGKYLMQGHNRNWTSDLCLARIYKGYNSTTDKQKKLLDYCSIQTEVIPVELKIKE